MPNSDARIDWGYRELALAILLSAPDDLRLLLYTPADRSTAYTRDEALLIMSDIELFLLSDMMYDLCDFVGLNNTVYCTNVKRMMEEVIHKFVFVCTETPNGRSFK